MTSAFHVFLIFLKASSNIITNDPEDTNKKSGVILFEKDCCCFLIYKQPCGTGSLAGFPLTTQSFFVIILVFPFLTPR